MPVLEGEVKELYREECEIPPPVLVCDKDTMDVPLEFDEIKMPWTYHKLKAITGHPSNDENVASEASQTHKRSHDFELTDTVDTILGKKNCLGLTYSSSSDDDT